MTLIEISKDYYRLALDQYGAPAFNIENFKLIYTFLQYDSNYSSVENEKHPQYQYTYAAILKHHRQSFFLFKKIEDYTDVENYMKNDPLYRVIESIDRMNSTHLASEGPKGGNEGRLKTAKFVYSIKNFKERLFKGDPLLVNEIATRGHEKGAKNNFSFASKFCAYLCRYIFEGSPQENNYCIYDDVVQSILPYFAHVYEAKVEKMYRINRDGCYISTVYKYKNQCAYEKYIAYVQAIIQKVQESTGINVTFEAFDHLLWYFFKGQSHKVTELMKRLDK